MYLILNEGLLIDFLQKKIINNWISRFLIHASFIFNESAVFTNLIRIYIDYIVWILNTHTPLSFKNPRLFLSINFFIIITILTTSTLIFILPL